MIRPVLGISLSAALVLGVVATTEPQTVRIRPMPPSIIARFTQVKGVVEVKSQGPAQQTSVWRPAKVGDGLRYGDLVKVQRTAIAEIQCTTNPSIRRAVPNDGIPWGIASVCFPAPHAR